MQGYGDWLQLSVFQCRLTRRRRAELETRLRELVKNGEDHVLLIDVGPADRIELAMASIGKTFAKIERRGDRHLDRIIAEGGAAEGFYLPRTFERRCGAPDARAVRLGAYLAAARLFDIAENDFSDGWPPLARDARPCSKPRRICHCRPWVVGWVHPRRSRLGLIEACDADCRRRPVGRASEAFAPRPH